MLGRKNGVIPGEGFGGGRAEPVALRARHAFRKGDKAKSAACAGGSRVVDSSLRAREEDVSASRTHFATRTLKRLAFEI